MNKLVENNDWDISRCSKPFCCKEDAEEYMQAKNFEDGAGTKRWINTSCVSYLSRGFLS